MSWASGPCGCVARRLQMHHVATAWNCGIQDSVQRVSEYAPQHKCAACSVVAPSKACFVICLQSKLHVMFDWSDVFHAVRMALLMRTRRSCWPIS